MSTQTNEEIAKESELELSPIDAKRNAAGHIECPRCDGDGLSDQDIDYGIDTCRMCRGDGQFPSKDLPRKLRAEERRLAKEQAEENPVLAAWKSQLN